MEGSPLAATLDRYAGFFSLFSDFDGYVDFFLLNDLTEVGTVRFFMPFDEDPNHRGGSRRWIMTEVENSLRRLGTDHIDLYQIHRYDRAVDLDETLGALTDLVRAGKVRYIGCSTFPTRP